MGKWPPATHTNDSKALPSSFTCTEVYSLVQCFQNSQPTSWLHDKKNNTCNLSKRNGIGPTNIQTRLVLKPSVTLTLPSPSDILWDLHNVLDAEIHVVTVDTAKKDKQNSKQMNKVGNIFLQQEQSPLSL